MPPQPPTVIFMAVKKQRSHGNFWPRTYRCRKEREGLNLPRWEEGGGVGEVGWGGGGVLLGKWRKMKQERTTPDSLSSISAE
jgi:hypothetical protein